MSDPVTAMMRALAPFVTDGGRRRFSLHADVRAGEVIFTCDGIRGDAHPDALTALHELAESVRSHAALKTREAHEIAAQAEAALAIVTDALAPIVEAKP